jgi:hypothetical protein
MRISSGVEKNSKMGGVQMMSQQRCQDFGLFKNGLLTDEKRGA